MCAEATPNGSALANAGIHARRLSRLRDNEIDLDTAIADAEREGDYRALILRTRERRTNPINLAAALSGATARTS